jgi:hypothetical protein
MHNERINTKGNDMHLKTSTIFRGLNAARVELLEARATHATWRQRLGDPEYPLAPVLHQLAIVRLYAAMDRVWLAQCMASASY